MYEEHPVFNPPPDDAILWRYMDFTKFVSLLDKRSLFFSAADKLRDPFEGSISEVNVQLHPIVYKNRTEDQRRSFIQGLKTLPRFHLINCWHENPYESEAMWRLYAREEDGIAIKTDFDSFKKSFICSETIFIGKVSYIDYKREFVPEDNAFHLFLHKRKSFAHEHEVRAISMRMGEDDEISIKLRTGSLFGVYYEVDLFLLIKEVIVAPFCSRLVP